MNRISFFVATSILLTVVNVAAVFGQSENENELRLWNDAQGNEITARFVRYREGVVYLRTNNRTTVQVRPSQLSKKDQEYTIKLLKDQKKEKLASEFSRLTESNQSGEFGNASNNGVRGGGTRRGSGAGRRPTNSGDASSSSTLSDEPDAFGSGAATPGGKSGFPGGGRSGTPGSRPPGTTPAGDGPVVFGGDPNRTPSPYLRTPDSEARELDSKPDGDPAAKKGGGFDPFAETGFNRPDVSKGIPSSSNDYLGEAKIDGSSSSAIKSKVKNPNIDPFAEMKPTESSSSIGKSKSNIVNNPFGNSSSQNGGYVPPVIDNKLDDSVSESDSSSTATTTSNGGMSNQTLILIAIGVVSFLILLMIALLVMVLVKSKQPKPRRSFF